MFLVGPEPVVPLPYARRDQIEAQAGERDGGVNGADRAAEAKGGGNALPRHRSHVLDEDRRHRLGRITQQRAQGVRIERARDQRQVEDRGPAVRSYPSDGAGRGAGVNSEHSQ
jgi:hypothetical protein